MLWKISREKNQEREGSRITQQHGMLSHWKEKRGGWNGVIQKGQEEEASDTQSWIILGIVGCYWCWPHEVTIPGTLNQWQFPGSFNLSKWYTSALKVWCVDSKKYRADHSVVRRCYFLIHIEKLFLNASMDGSESSPWKSQENSKVLIQLRSGISIPPSKKV